MTMFCVVLLLVVSILHFVNLFQTTDITYAHILYAIVSAIGIAFSLLTMFIWVCEHIKIV